jgi:uncharacterized metal-binding protein YceD (DUF177 family)
MEISRPSDVDANMSEQSSPWHVPLATADIPPHGVHRDLTAGPNVQAELAAIANVQGITNLSASFDVTPERSDSFRVTGTVRGQVSQTCVVSLEPLQNEVEEEIDVIFAPEHEAEAARARLAKEEEEGEGSGDDPPEAIRGGVIDLGSLAAEFFVLGIDPYPRRPGTQFEAILTPPDAEDHPFAALAALKEKAGRPADGEPKPRVKKRPT